MLRFQSGKPSVAPGFLALSCVGFVSAPATAQDTAAQPEAGKLLGSVTVTSTAIDDQSYHGEPAASPKFTAPLIDTPRSVVVIPQEVIRDTGSASLTEALRTVPGITFGAAEGGNPIGDRPFIRGFDTQGSTFLDGVRDIGAQTREVFAVDQVQVVRGSDSTLGGRGGAGGSINIISKLPKADQDFAQVDGSFGNAAYKRLTADVNYQLTPRIGYAKITDLCLNTPHAAGPFFYVMACVSRKIEPVIEDGKRFTWHHGELTAGRKYFILEYPSPPPLDLSEVPIDEMIGGKSPIVLAPYFSAVLRNESGGETNYYVLGQAPIGGGTTLRHLSADGVNSNLGPGSAPQLTDFLAAIRGA